MPLVEVTLVNLKCVSCGKQVGYVVIAGSRQTDVLGVMSHFTTAFCLTCGDAEIPHNHEGVKSGESN